MEHLNNSFSAHHPNSPNKRITETPYHEEAKDDINNSDPSEESGVVDRIPKEESEQNKHIGASVAFVDDVDAAEV